MMHVYLIIAPIKMRGLYYPDVEPGYIKTYVQKKCSDVKVSLFDLNLVAESHLFEEMEKDNPQLIGITCFSPNRFASIDLAQKIKKMNPETLMVFRGNHASNLYQQMLDHYPWIDLIVRGESEEAFVELVDYINGRKAFKDISGICYREDDQIVSNPKRPFLTHLDDLPFPEYVEHSITYRGRKLKAAQIVTSRGCSNGCKFCAAPPFFGNARFRSAQNILDELTMLVQEHDVEYIHFRDDTFTEIPSLVHEICDLIIKRDLKFKWQVLTRVNTLDESMLKAMKAAGCVQIGLGIESGNQGILDRMSKKTPIHQIIEISQLIKEVGIDLHVCLMVGSPGETDETVKETKSLIQRIRPDSFSISRGMYLLPGTPFAIEFQRKGEYSDEQWLNRDVHYVRYLGENSEETIRRWHLSMTLVCWLQLSWARKINYLTNMIKWFGFKQLFDFLKPSPLMNTSLSTSSDSL